MKVEGGLGKRIRTRFGQRASLALAMVLSVGLSARMPAQPPSPSFIASVTDRALPAALEELTAFLAIPNDGNYAEQVEANLTWCRDRFTELDYTVIRLETPGQPLLFAEHTVDPELPTVLFYLQIDGQPVDTSAWDQPNPYRAVWKRKNEDGRYTTFDRDPADLDPELRLFARSASDSKGPAISFITALDILRSEGIAPAFNVKVIMDFQEEMGSDDLPGAVAANRERFDADFLVIMDGTRHVSNEPTLTFGARGIATVTMRLFGPAYALHSGQYGNFAPNPVFAASRLLAAMKDESGRVLIPGFYDGVKLTEAEKEEMNRVPESREAIRAMVGIAENEALGDSYQEALQYPSLNVRGLRSGWTGKEVRTLIPEDVVIELDMRLVPETPGERQVNLLRQFVAERGYHFVDSIPTEEERLQYPKLICFTSSLGSVPFRTDLGTPIDRWLTAAIRRGLGREPVRMRTTGGSQPMGPFVNLLGLPAVSLRIPNPDNSIHAPNENLRLGNFREGIAECLAVLTQAVPGG
ncbi:acetylornithine deacetylase/succinyl-diaminopimelate desuccinylase-like protein [Neolewinella xylanilytica]|uniref:Acetylornithine deacetylase/succinyl-diaminopimelate desuccinylase-like protein n=1 Tax=Neolewinella xylanilytica TaxID=1514080 RepID=A0A2S6I126_9BACT|nr:M20/M25/M40 family metallo-hydrolase [Neolewinella xylanilytica]PPK84581.1 acetylornithine deacetylase/succinyl-diaminopimelate desuccinylase-like protein [Neolewinella xylanilytica]